MAYRTTRRVSAVGRVVRRTVIVAAAAAVLALVACGRSGSEAVDAGGDDAVYTDSDPSSDAALPPCIDVTPASHRIALAGNVSNTDWMDVLVVDLDGGT